MTISVASVICDVGNVMACLRPDERAFIKADPIDVEDWGTLTGTFSDGTKATVFSGDMIMGGVRNLIKMHTSGGSLFANITPNTHMMSYQTSEEKLASVYITEKWIERPDGNTFASRRNGRAAIRRKSRVSWNAPRPVDSRFPISRWPLRRPKSTAPPIGPPKRAVALRCDAVFRCDRFGLRAAPQLYSRAAPPTTSCSLKMTQMLRI
jgi:hypothetical protein